MNQNESEQNLDAEPGSPHLLANMDRIFGYMDGSLPIEERGLFERHLNACAECQAFYGKAERLELALARNIIAPALSSGFTASLWERINSPAQLESVYDEQRRKIELEFQTNSARLRNQLFRSSNLLDGLSYGVALAMSAYLLVRLVVEFPAEWLPGFGGNRVLLASWVAGAAGIICGLVFVINQRQRRWSTSS